MGLTYFLIEIQGDPDRAAGLLAKDGIQNVVTAKPPDAPRSVAARVSGKSAELAVERVRRALEGEPFTVAEARLEKS